MIVVFNPDEFREFYPKFSEVSDDRLDFFFNLACSYIGNTDNSKFPYNPAQKIFVRKQLLYMLVCHLCTLEKWGDKQSGPITSASQGSVSVGFANVEMWGNAFFSQTQCGRAMLQMMAPYALGGKLIAATSLHPNV